MAEADGQGSESVIQAVERLGREAVRRHRGGDPNGSVPLYRKALGLDPSQWPLWYYLGAACEAAGLLDEAEASLREALRLKPAHADAHNHLGVVRARLGRLAEAVLSFRQALRLRPGHAQAADNLRKARLQQNAEADGVAGRATAAAAADLPSLLQQGRGLLEQGRFDDASECFREALRRRPDFADAYRALGVAHVRRGGRLPEAAACLEEAIRLNPADHQSQMQLGAVCRVLGQFGAAQASYEHALRLRPDSLEARLGLGEVLADLGRAEPARECYCEALRLRPDSVTARFGACFASLAGVYENEDDVTRRRETYRSDLETLTDNFPFGRPEAVAEAVEALGRWTPFFLPYQGRDDRDLQALYGRFASRVLAARYPQWAASPAVPPPAPGERIRVGVVSAFMNLHSNWKIPIRGWAQNLDRRKLELFGYHLGGGRDSETAAARRLFDHYSENGGSLEGWAGVLARDRLHVLLYPELGMFPLTVQLAALRLAPVQCVSWGHPNTSGLPTMDYFLSSDLMEPPDAQRHYTEELVRLPNLSVHCLLFKSAPTPLDLAAHGVRPGAVRYLCCQTPSKYLPQHDFFYCRIAARVPEAQFLFLGLGKANGRAEQLRSRLSRAFAAAGLDAGRHLVFLPPLNAGQYEAVNRAADVFLDNVSWSGCNTTLEALACGLPVVTLPGALMRGRHTLAMLRMMGATDGVAADAADFVSRAATLGRDRAAREAVRAKVVANRDKVYGDRDCIRALEDFFERAVARHYTSPHV